MQRSTWQRSTSYLALASWALVVGLAGVGCSGSSTGSPGSGGSSATGGKGSGGAATGGTPATGGAQGSGGKQGTGGTASPDAGSSSGGNIGPGSGGANSGGSPADAGNTASGGATGSGGNANTDGGQGQADRPGDATTANDSGGAGMGGGDAGAASGRSSGCGKTTTKPNATTQQTMQVSGNTRYYLLDVPSGYSSSTPMPLVFVFHGKGMNNVWASQGGIDWAGKFNLQSVTGGKAILVFPQGSGPAPGNSANFSGDSTWNENPDINFFDALWTDLESKYCVDTKHVFSTGFSMGGAFTNTLGCKRSNIIRAIAPVSGWGPNASPSGSAASCSNSKGAEAAMVYHGTADTVVTYSSGQASAQFWRTDNGCTATTSSSSTYSGCTAYQGCAAGHEVFFCSHSGEHTVPSNAGSNMWKFFSTLP